MVSVDFGQSFSRVRQELTSKAEELTDEQWKPSFKDCLSWPHGAKY